jgi:hypothetical protein
LSTAGYCTAFSNGNVGGCTYGETLCKQTQYAMIYYTTTDCSGTEYCSRERRVEPRSERRSAPSSVRRQRRALLSTRHWPTGFARKRRIDHVAQDAGEFWTLAAQDDQEAAELDGDGEPLVPVTPNDDLPRNTSPKKPDGTRPSPKAQLHRPESLGRPGAIHLSARRGNRAAHCCGASCQWIR